MANPKHVAILRAGVICWNNWREIYAGDERLDLSDAELNQIDLTAIKTDKGYKRINLEGVYLEGAKLNGAHLERANLEGAALIGAALWKANLEGADLRYVKDLTQVQLDQACGDDKTQLPEKLRDYRIKGCPRDKDESMEKPEDATDKVK